MKTREITKEVREISKDIIIGHCNGRELPLFWMMIVGKDYWIYEKWQDLADYKKFLDHVSASGYEKCLRRDASHYALFCEGPNAKSIWIRKIQVKHTPDKIWGAM